MAKRNNKFSWESVSIFGGGFTSFNDLNFGVTVRMMESLLSVHFTFAKQTLAVVNYQPTSFYFNTVVSPNSVYYGIAYKLPLKNLLGNLHDKKHWLNSNWTIKPFFIHLFLKFPLFSCLSKSLCYARRELFLA